MAVDDVEISLSRDALNVRGIDWVFNDRTVEGLELDDLPRPDPAEESQIQGVVKGLLWNASLSLVDRMFDDLATVTADDDSDDAYRPQYVLSMLPGRFIEH